MGKMYPFHSLWREMEKRRAELETMYQQASEGGKRLLLPGGITDQLLPAIRGDVRVDGRDLGENVTVAADMPGFQKENITIHLLNPQTLELSGKRSEEKEAKTEDYFVRERISGQMRRLVPLPTYVSEDNSQAMFKDGVLTVTLKKTALPERPRIEIQ